MVLDIPSAQLRLECSSLRHFQLYIGLGVLLLFWLGLLLGSGLVELKRALMPLSLPSVEIRHQLAPSKITLPSHEKLPDNIDESLTTTNPEFVRINPTGTVALVKVCRKHDNTWTVC